MKTLFTILILLVCHSIAHAQTNFTSEAEKDLKPLFEKFTAKKSELVAQQTILEQMTKRLDPASKDQMEKTRNLKKGLDSIYNKQETFKSFYKYRGVPKESLDKFFPVDTTYQVLGEITDTEEKAIYLLYGENRIVEEKLFKGDKRIEDIFKNILVDSETSLGSFEIPGNRQKIEVKKKNSNTIKYVYFENVKFSLRDGCVNDIRVTVSDSLKKFNYYFENLVPVSLLKYTRASSRSLLRNRTTTQMEIGTPTDTILDGYDMKISDVLSYLPNPGNNFVPDDEEFSFPKNEENDGKQPKRREYKIIQKTNLQNVLELRAYTDFLALFDDAPNGIAQFEGKADFFIAPFQITKTFPFTLFKKVSPYVHFAKLNDTVRNLTLTEKEDAPGNYTIDRPLEIIEKSYLDMGVLLDIACVRFTKEFPFNINFYGALRYQVATIGMENKEDENFKTVGNGFGARLEFKRFNNFGLCFSPEWTYYNHLNRIDSIEIPRNFWVFRNEAEVYFYPGTTKSQAVFLRLRTFLDLGDREDSFFQLQFGYRFSIGLGDVKTKN